MSGSKTVRDAPFSADFRGFSVPTVP